MLVAGCDKLWRRELTTSSMAFLICSFIVALSASLSKSVITNRPSIGFFGPRTFLLVPVVVVETKGYVGKNKTINKGIFF
jgi:hypothetical protein